MSEMPTTCSASTDLPAFVTGQTLPKNTHACPNREAGLLGLCHLKPAYFDRLLALSPGEWRKVFYWLDVSGLTLSFAHQVNELNLQGSLPATVNQRLQKNLSDNRARVKGLLQEYAGLQEEFQRAEISYAVLSELRYQFDLDFLVDESSASKARAILEQAGFRLYATSGRVWEFRKNETSGSSGMDKGRSGPKVELHIETVPPGRESLLSRREYREIQGVTMPVLALPDLFLWQSVQAFDGVCSSFLRASRLLELYRHMCARGDDPVFWSKVRDAAKENPSSILGLGVVLQLIESVMEAEVPSKLAMWTMLCLPAPVQRWIALYGKSCVYGLPPGTKLYLLLERELEQAGVSFPQSARKAQESVITRVRAVPLRLRFHFVEGLRYAWASYRWR